VSLRPLLAGLRRAINRPEESTLRLVVGVNRVDEIVPDGWNAMINLPTPEAAIQIRRRCSDIARLISEVTHMDSAHIEYYSALKRYRLYELLNRVIKHSYAGFKFADIEPLHFEDVEGVAPEVRRRTKEERQRRQAAATEETPDSGEGRLLAGLAEVIGSADLGRIRDKFGAEMQRPPRITVLGQSGVGKTTTVNALFATDWRTSPVEVGTDEAQDHTASLPSGGLINIVDLPGYGRSIADDSRYEKIYREIIPSCDLVLLIIQADRGDLADDQEMIIHIQDWIRDAPRRD
jgi:predicted GTPase